MKRSKKWGIVLGLVLAIGGTSQVLWAQKDIGLVINGKIIEVDVAPVLENEVTFVPISFIASGLEAVVDWQKPQVIIKQGGQVIKCTVGSKIATLNGEEISLAAPPKLEKGRVLVPLRFVAETLGASVNYEKDTRIVNILRRGDKEPSEEATSENENNQEYYEVFFDESSGNFIYRTRDWLFYDTKAQTWSKLNNKKLVIYDAGDNKYPGVIGKGHLDFKNQQIIEECEYKETPDGKWRYMQKREWGGLSDRCDVGFIQNVETGVIQEIFRSNSSPTVYVLPNNTFWVEISVPRVGEEQIIYPSEVFIYHPQKDKMELIAKGRRSRYVKEQKAIAYQANTRYYAYQLENQMIQEITEQAYYEKFDKMSENKGLEERSKAPQLPSVEERESLPELELASVIKNYGTLTINNHVEKLTFIYKKDGEIYLPVKSINSLISLQIIKKESNLKEAVFGGKSIVLDEKNSSTFEERLYISEKVLGQLGIEAKITFNKNQK